MDLLNISKSRYTTKAYDPNRKIPHEQFTRLLEILRLNAIVYQYPALALLHCRKHKRQRADCKSTSR